MSTYWFTIKYFSHSRIEEVTIARKTDKPDEMLAFLEQNVRGWNGVVSLIDSFYSKADLG